MENNSQIEVREVDFYEFEDDIKEWIRAYLDWSHDELTSWIRRKIRSGNEQFEELLEVDWEDALDQLFEEDIENFKSNSEDTTIIGVIDGEKLVGGLYLHLLGDGDRAKINRVFLPEEYRGNNYGFEMCEMAVEKAEQKNVDVIRVATGEFMTGEGIYESLGFDYLDGPYPSATTPEPLYDYWTFMEYKTNSDD